MIRPDTPTSTGYGHFRAAEQLLTPQPTDPEGTAFRYPTGDDLTAAQAHATLALAAATALAIPDECVGERLVAAWHEAGAW